MINNSSGTESRTTRHSGLFYGWVIVASCLIIGCILFGVRLSFGVFFKSLEAEFQLSRTETSLIFSACMASSAVFSVAGGWAVDRWGPRRTISAMGIISGASLFLVYLTTAFWQLFLSYGLLLAVGTGGTYTVLIAATSRWFIRRRSLAMGIAGAGAAFGAVIFAPVSAFLIANLGWRMSYLTLGILAFIVLLALAALFRRDPAEMGLLPDGSTAVALPQGNSAAAHLPGMLLREAIATPTYWLYGFVWLLFSLGTTMVIAHAVPFITDSGISTEVAAGVIGLAGLTSVPSRLLTGWVADRVGYRLPGIIWGLAQAGAMILLTQANAPWMFYVFGVIWGSCWGGIGIVTTTAIVHNFGIRNLGTIMGSLDVFFGAGSAIGPAVAGLVYDRMGSYIVAWVVAAGAAVILALLIALTRKRLPRPSP